MKMIYPSKKGGKPMNIGMNRAKRIAHSMDQRDRLKILQVLGTGMPKRDIHNSELVRSRHRYYSEAESVGTQEVSRSKYIPHQGVRECKRRKITALRIRRHQAQRRLRDLFAGQPYAG